MKNFLGRLNRRRSWHLRADKDGTFSPENAPSPLTVPSDVSSSSSSEGGKDAYENDEPQWFPPSTTDWSPDDDGEGPAPSGVDEDVFWYLEQQRQSQGRNEPSVKGSAWARRMGRTRSTPGTGGLTPTSPLSRSISFGRVRSSFWRQTLNAPPSTLPPTEEGSVQITDDVTSRRVKFLADTEDDLFSVATPIIDSDDGTAEAEEEALQPTEHDAPKNEPVIKVDDTQCGCFSKEMLITYAKLLVSDATACCNV